MSKDTTPEQQKATFVISVNDSYCEWAYTFNLPSNVCIEDVARTIAKRYDTQYTERNLTKNAYDMRATKRNEDGNLPAKMVEPRWTHETDICELPPKWQEFVHDVSMEDEYHCYDYRDGDYRYKIDLSNTSLPYHVNKEQWDEFIHYLTSNLPKEVIDTNSYAICCWH